MKHWKNGESELVSHFVFDDGTINSKVLQFEIKDAEVIEVKPYTKLDTWLAEIPQYKDEIQKIFLHFSSGDLIRQDVDIRTDVMEAQHKYPNMRIILQYEQMDRQTIENRAAKYGIPQWTEKHDKIVQEYESKQQKEVVIIPRDPVDKIIEGNKDKIKIIDYSKYAVGGNDTVVPPKDKPNMLMVGDNPGGRESINIDPFTKKYNEFKDRRRRKKKE